MRCVLLINNLPIVQAFISLKHDSLQLSCSAMLYGETRMCNCKLSANEWCVIGHKSILVNKGLIYMQKRIGSRTVSRRTRDYTDVKAELSFIM